MVLLLLLLFTLSIESFDIVVGTRDEASKGERSVSVKLKWWLDWFTVVDIWDEFIENLWTDIERFNMNRTRKICELLEEIRKKSIQTFRKILFQVNLIFLHRLIYFLRLSHILNKNRWRKTSSSWFSKQVEEYKLMERILFVFFFFSIEIEEGRKIFECASEFLQCSTQPIRIEWTIDIYFNVCNWNFKSERERERQRKNIQFTHPRKRTNQLLLEIPRLFQAKDWILLLIVQLTKQKRLQYLFKINLIFLSQNFSLFVEMNFFFEEITRRILKEFKLSMNNDQYMSIERNSLSITRSISKFE